MLMVTPYLPRRGQGKRIPPSLLTPASPSRLSSVHVEMVLQLFPVVAGLPALEEHRPVPPPSSEVYHSPPSIIPTLLPPHVRSQRVTRIASSTLLCSSVTHTHTLDQRLNHLQLSQSCKKKELQISPSLKGENPPAFYTTLQKLGREKGRSPALLGVCG